MSYSLNKIQYVEPSKSPMGFHIRSPATGVINRLADSSNSLVSSGCLGEGLSIRLTGNRILSPFDGIVNQVSATGHRILLTAKNHLKLLLLLTITDDDKQNLNLRVAVKPTMTISTGQLLAQIDTQKTSSNTANHQIYLHTMITNAELVGKIYYTHHKVDAGADIIMTATKAKFKKIRC